MFETAIVAFTTLFATVGPIDVAAVFAALTAGSTPRERYRIAVRGSVTATVILLLFAITGEAVLNMLGISMAALRTAGGILLLLISIEMVFARPSGATSTTDAEVSEAKEKQDIAIFPLASPLIAGPGSIAATVLLMAGAEGSYTSQAVVLASILLIMLLTLMFLLTASHLHRILGITGMQVINRVFGILLAALAVQFIFDGIIESKILE